MKICFLSNGTIQYGSYRIWVHDLNNNFAKLGYFSQINPTKLESFNVIIFGKDYITNISKIHKKYPDKIYGAINIENKNKDFYSFIDFVIVGSVEEKDSLLKFCKNIFIYPLIENMYLNVTRKVHVPKKKITLGYHGNTVHLNHLSLGFNTAIKKIIQNYPNLHFKLVCITNSFNHWQKKNYPEMEIELIKWNLQTIRSSFKNIDIGIIPTISDVIKKNSHEPLIGKYDSDITIRFKNKSNIGRALVFFQFGIPVIADYTPSNMSILGDEEQNGFAVLSHEGWYYAIEKLLDDKLRNQISNNAFKTYQNLYNPDKWSDRIWNQIKNIAPSQ
tara:strand:- start:457 stop:1449 length:993 start_codon:yes stop_codon:yes gene_type:complete